MAPESLYDVIILGSGPAGLTAAIYTSRAKFKTLVVGGAVWGGQLMFTMEVENFPGFPEGILGPDLMDGMRKQAKRFGAKVILENMTSVDFSSKPFKVSIGDQSFGGRAVIIATGASPQWLGFDSETRLRGSGVSVCATCDAAFFADKKAVVVGGGDTAMEEALTVSKFAREVIVIHRRNKLRASKILQERVFDNRKISFIFDSVILDVFGQDKVEAVKIKNAKTGEESQLATDAVFVAIGYKPNTDLLKGQVELNERGYITTHGDTKTSVEGVFVAGDVHDYTYRQAVTAAGAGCKAAIDAEKYLYTHPQEKKS